MNIIPPREIAAKIMTLIELADEKVILISPYVQVNKWPQMKTTIQRAINKGVEFEFYTRHDQTASIEEIEKLGLIPVLIENLHAKIYMNEKYGIISSQNLYLYSDINSLDIGVEVRGEDFIELQEYYKNYVIKNIEIHNRRNEKQHTGVDKKLLSESNIYDMICTLISNSFPDWRIDYYEKNHVFRFDASSRSFELFYDFDEQRKTRLNFESILTQNLFDYLKPREEEIRKVVGEKFNIVDPGKGFYNVITYEYTLPEKKLRDCDEDQILDLVKSISAAFIVPMEMVKNSGIVKISKYL